MHSGNKLKSAWNVLYLLCSHTLLFLWWTIHPCKLIPKNYFFASIIFNPNLKMLLPSKMKGLLWWHQFDGLGMIMTSLTTPLQPSVFISELNAYFTSSNQYAVEKTSHAAILLIQYYVSLGSMSQYVSKNSRKLPVHVDFKYTAQFLCYSKYAAHRWVGLYKQPVVTHSPPLALETFTHYCVYIIPQKTQ